VIKFSVAVLHRSQPPPSPPWFLLPPDFSSHVIVIKFSGAVLHLPYTFSPPPPSAPQWNQKTPEDEEDDEEAVYTDTVHIDWNWCQDWDWISSNSSFTSCKLIRLLLSVSDMFVKSPPPPPFLSSLLPFSPSYLNSPMTKFALPAVQYWIGTGLGHLPHRNCRLMRLLINSARQKVSQTDDDSIFAAWSRSLVIQSVWFQLAVSGNLNPRPGLFPSGGLDMGRPTVSLINHCSQGRCQRSSWGGHAPPTFFKL